MDLGKWATVCPDPDKRCKRPIGLAVVIYRQSVYVLHKYDEMWMSFQSIEIMDYD
jgi:hypothetical protein